MSNFVIRAGTGPNARITPSTGNNLVKVAPAAAAAGYTLLYTGRLLAAYDLSDGSTVFSDAGSTNSNIGDNVYQINDKSGNSNNLTRQSDVNIGTYETGDHGKPVLRTTVANNWYNFATAITTATDVFWVIKRGAGQQTGNYYFVLGDTNNYDYHSDTAFRLFSAAFSSITSFRLDKVAGTKSSTVSPTTDKVLSAAKASATWLRNDRYSEDRIYGRSWIGDLSMLLIYGGDATPFNATEIEAVEDSLKNYYSI